MISFCNDYSEGCNPEILALLKQINLNQYSGYGMDEMNDLARDAIKRQLANEQVDIHFLVGGTQSNLVIISSALRPYEAVIAASTGHINVHETGSIEACGHKVLTPEGESDKLSVEDVDAIIQKHVNEHMVKPGMVYISLASELGSVYSKSELEALYAYCKAHHLYFMIDGARIANALASDACDVEWKDLCDLCDVFYLGGTKNGALFGEAVVIVSDALKPDFRYMMKQRGAMLAKGWLLGAQFYVLFKEGLYMKNGLHANQMARQLQDALKTSGIELLKESSTNQIFPIFAEEEIDFLKKNYAFEDWGSVDAKHRAIRLVCSWATSQAQVDAFISDLHTLKKTGH